MGNKQKQVHELARKLTELAADRFRSPEEEDGHAHDGASQERNHRKAQVAIFDLVGAGEWGGKMHTTHKTQTTRGIQAGWVGQCHAVSSF